MPSDTRWSDVQRIESWAGETRVNLLRLAAIVAFYGHHLVNLWLYPQDESLRGIFHAGATGIVITWATAALILGYCLAQRWAPPALKYVASFFDIGMTTALLCLPGNGPKSPLLVLYFLIIAASALRLTLPLVYATTLGTLAGYLLVLGCFVFVQVGAAKYYAAGSPHFVPRSHEIIFALALGTAGLIAGQIVRQCRRLVRGYPVAVAEGEDQ